MRHHGPTKEEILSIQSKIGLFLAVFGVAVVLSAHLVSAAVLDVSNAEKLSLPTSTPIGQQVRVSDGFIVSGAGTDDANGLYTLRDTQEGRPRFNKATMPTGVQGAIYHHGGLWVMTYSDRGGDASYHDSASENPDYDYDAGGPATPFDIVWSPDNGSLPNPTITHPAIQELAAPSTDLTAVFISGAGTAEANGIYTDRGDNGGVHYYNLIGSPNNPDASSIVNNGTRWFITDSSNDPGLLYRSTNNPIYPWQATWVVDEDEGDRGSAPSPTASSTGRGDLDAGVTVAGAGTETSNGVFVTSLEVAFGKPKFMKVGSVTTQLRATDNNAGITGYYLFDPAISDYSYNPLEPDPAFPSGDYETNNGTPPPPTVTRNDVAAEANWIVSSLPVATELNFDVEPSDTMAGETITPSVKVEVLDDEGDLFTDATSTVTLSLGSNPGSSTLSGSTTKAAVSGVATFDDLSINNAGVGYTLIASASGLASATSITFDISAVVSTSTPPSGGGSHSSGNHSSGSSTSLPPPTPGTPSEGCLFGDLFNRFTGAPCPLDEQTPPFTFLRDLTLGSRGEDVRQLQIYLNTHGFLLASFGPGAIGQETFYFGPLTKAALARFQAAHGITPSVGFFGPITKAVISILLAS